jgi:hypothetical protein
MPYRLVDNVARVARVARVILPIMVAALVLVAILVVMQGQRDEAHNADAILVFCPNSPEAHLAHTLALYRVGLAPRILIVGEDPQPIQQAFAQNDTLQKQTFFMQTTGKRQQDMVHVAHYAAQQHIHSVVLVDTPEAMLTTLKMSHDLGLQAYGSPLPNVAPHALAVIQASLDYWQYVLFNGHIPQVPSP